MRSTGRQAETEDLIDTRGSRKNLGVGPAADAADGLMHRILGTCVVGVHRDGPSVDADRFDSYGEDVRHLEFLERLVQQARLRPPAHARVDGVPSPVLRHRIECRYQVDNRPSERCGLGRRGSVARSRS